jgi:hypothetical protein
MLTRHGTMPTDRPERYAKQLAGHWARKGSTGEEEGATVIRFARVVAEHLQRFGHRDELVVAWESGMM